MSGSNILEQQAYKATQEKIQMQESGVGINLCKGRINKEKTVALLRVVVTTD